MRWVFRGIIDICQKYFGWYFWDKIAESVDFQGLERDWGSLIYRFSIKRKSSRSGDSYYLVGR